MTVKLTMDEKNDIQSIIQRFFEQERGEELGIIGTEQFFAMIDEEIGRYYYNKGLVDAKRLIEEKMMGVDEDISALEILPPRRPRIK
ncbi:hypothetical protein N781_07055 [Pontibacillus halophilus JSM 076056 = DSM 19796]|uniref:DUF2164 domain-containing protein n=1 Tax=Pontibacillus halophilus JSM 076056 = DSM 19796 TaxID=1385510 RepID=A0A0A5GHH9_9BACI|nr:DUF2164 domain-containing protein [Pontibacillus halophilus]KGX90545.1 hypothetical protein N781_07055 [Pontibacillus halophilus JSM 076056 = DSM 19796]